MADIVVIAAVGVAAGTLALGWAGAALAVLVAYTRQLGKGVDRVVDFAGPLAESAYLTTAETPGRYRELIQLH